jgi:hypothetical protein
MEEWQRRRRTEGLDPFANDAAGLGAGVGLAVAPTAHRGDHAVGGELGAEAFAGIGAVGVQEQPRRATSAAITDGLAFPALRAPTFPPPSAANVSSRPPCRTAHVQHRTFHRPHPKTRT